MYLVDLEGRLGSDGHAGCSSDLDHIAVRGEQRRRGDTRLDVFTETQAEGGEAVMSDVTATPRQSIVLNDDAGRIDQLEQANEILVDHRSVDREHDIEVVRFTGRD